MKIKAWHIGIVWEDDTEEALADIPDWVAKRVDEFLDELEEEDDDNIWGHYRRYNRYQR